MASIPSKTVTVAFTEAECAVILPYVEDFKTADAKGRLRIAQVVAGKIKRWNGHLPKEEWEARKKVSFCQRDQIFLIVSYALLRL
jgi:hypothetical protein